MTRPTPESSATRTGRRKPRRSLGQNFLKDQRVAARIVRACKVDGTQTVVEVGPGRGALTRHLVDRCSRLVLVEKDSALVSELKSRYREKPEVRVVEGDAAVLAFDEVLDGSSNIAVGNLPYNAAGPILFNLLGCRRRLLRAVLMFQREVARRLTAIPGERAYGAVSLLVHAWTVAEALFDVAPDRFSPQPKVWSAVVRLTPREKEQAPADPAFGQLVHALHARPRKTVRNSLSEGLKISPGRTAALLEAAGIDPSVRPCCVTPPQAFELWSVYNRDLKTV